MKHKQTKQQKNVSAAPGNQEKSECRFDGESIVTSRFIQLGINTAPLEVNVGKRYLGRTLGCCPWAD